MERLLLSQEIFLPCYHRVLNQFFATAEGLNVSQDHQWVCTILDDFVSRLVSNPFLSSCLLESSSSKSHWVLHIDLEKAPLPLFGFLKETLRAKKINENQYRILPFQVDPVQAFLLQIPIRSLRTLKKESLELQKVPLRQKFNEMVEKKLYMLMDNQTRSWQQLRELIDQNIPDFYDKTKLYLFLNERRQYPIVVADFVKYFQLNLLKKNPLKGIHKVKQYPMVITSGKKWLHENPFHISLFEVKEYQSRYDTIVNSVLRLRRAVNSQISIPAMKQLSIHIHHGLKTIIDSAAKKSLYYLDHRRPNYKTFPTFLRTFSIPSQDQEGFFTLHKHADAEIHDFRTLLNDYQKNKHWSQSFPHASALDELETQVFFPLNNVISEIKDYFEKSQNFFDHDTARGLVIYARQQFCNLLRPL